MPENREQINLATPDQKPGRPIVIGAANDTGSRIPYENTAAGEDDTPIRHVYQTSDGEEVTEEIPISDATFVPNRDNNPIVTPPEEEKVGNREAA